jgi:hypothetical protein
MHDSGDLTLAALTVRQAAQAMETSLDLESPQLPPVQYALPAADDVLAAPSPLHKQLESHEVVGSGKLSAVCVTTAAHDPAPIPEHAVNDSNSRDQEGMIPNYISAMSLLLANCLGFIEC